MGKIFRLHKSSGDNIRDWAESTVIGKTERGEINDPSGADAKNEITSIPSPFARIDLIKTAFYEIDQLKDKIKGKHCHLDGNTIFHKMVSDTFDVAEIFFNYSRFKDKFEIIEWNRSQIEAIGQTSQVLKNSLDIFFKQDAKAYNFDQVKSLYLLNYIGNGSPNQDLNIVGATSPSTLFFPSNNDLSYIGESIQFEENIPFDNNYLPLYRRDFEFVKYFFCLRKSNTDFIANFPELNDYLDATFKILSDSQKSILKAISVDDYHSNYAAFEKKVEILGYPVLIKKTDLLQIQDKSDFVINSDFVRQSLPLVLPDEYNTANYTDLFYLTNKWSSDFKIINIDIKIDINNRVLPFNGEKYPYLSINDFFEEKLIGMRHPINNDSFFSGEDHSPKEYKPDYGFLIPLKKIYFNYFKPDSLFESIGGRKRFEFIRINGNAIKAILRIPIRTENRLNYIEYSKTYSGFSDEDNVNPDIIIKRFGLAVLPLVKFKEKEKPFYNISLIDSSYEGNSKINLEFYQANNNVKSKNFQRLKGNKDSLGINLCSVNQNFDYMQLKVDDEFSNVIIPKFENTVGNNRFTFAVDFGTTNTHIEYYENDQCNPKPFEINLDKQIHKLNIDYYLEDDIDIALNQYVIPQIIDQSSNYNFPIRTIIMESNKASLGNLLSILNDVNIPFVYEKDTVDTSNNKISTNIKWNQNEEQRIKKFLEELLILMRNKVLINNGRLNETKLVWSYPTSLSTDGRVQLNKIWEILCEEYFNISGDQIKMISESIAPYYYFSNKEGAISSVLNIDIGGGTTDIVYVDSGIPKLLSSFRFAANNIFGDGFANNVNNNSFVQLYKNKLTECGILTPDGVDVNSSVDLTTFYFSISKNKSFIDKDFDYEALLKSNSQIKYIFLIFYSSIIFHVAKLLKVNNFKTPHNITFTGNGSRMLNILGGDNQIQVFTNKIFTKVFNKTEKIKIIRNKKNPKEATSKGSLLYINNPVVNIETDNIKRIYNPFDSENTLDQIDDECIDRLEEEIREFYNIFIEIHNEIDYKDKFNVDLNLLEDVDLIFKSSLDSYIRSKVDERKQEKKSLGGGLKIDETMFFYGIEGIIRQINSMILNSKKV